MYFSLSLVFFLSTYTMNTAAFDLSPTIPKIKNDSSSSNFNSSNSNISVTVNGSHIVIHDNNKYNKNEVSTLKPDGADHTNMELRINTPTSKPENDSNTPKTDTLTDSNGNDVSDYAKKRIIIAVIIIFILVPVIIIVFISICFCLRKRYKYAQKIWSGLTKVTSKCICLKCEGGMSRERDIERGLGDATDGEKEKLNDDT